MNAHVRCIGRPTTPVARLLMVTGNYSPQKRAWQAIAGRFLLEVAQRRRQRWHSARGLPSRQGLTAVALSQLAHPKDPRVEYRDLSGQWESANVGSAEAQRLEACPCH